ncbi:MAG: transposase, partial [Anaerocolumna sp.]
MIYQGFSKGRSRAKCSSLDECPLDVPCSPSSYGRVVYTKPDWDIRLFPPVPRGSREWKDTYSTRTCSERVNNRVLNDYHLHDMRIHGKKRYSFFTMMIGINI